MEVLLEVKLAAEESKQGVRSGGCPGTGREVAALETCACGA